MDDVIQVRLFPFSHHLYRAMPALAKIHYDNLLRTKPNVFGIAVATDDNGMNFPLSLLNISAKDTYTLTSFKVFAILEENKSTHAKKCLLKDKNCNQKIDNYIDQLLDISQKDDF
ncbi:hypothetical protein ACKP2L_00115 (plasmid) [Oenococcus alcoholitolerans]|uniref:Uncharacterized protein n=1 Tax=Oenococcus alcoholitolerans TaxID=931074 RepID=A0ABR4XSD9_9LACO|nr:hypothetical protein Q757_01195 [Oenococcus alcoholitolerans]